MRAWFLALPGRDQLALLILAIVLVLYASLMLLVMPMERARDRLAQTNAATAEVLVRVDGMAAAILAQRETGARPTTAARNLTTLLNGSAEAAGLRISRLQPNSRGGVQLRFESAPFDSFLRWLHDLEHTQGLLLEELSISQSGSPGIVSASLRVASPL